MRIAIVVERFPAVSETFITNKVLELCRRGHKVTVFTHRQSKDEGLRSLYQLDAIGNLQVIAPVIPTSKTGWLKTVLFRPGLFLSALSSARNAKENARTSLLASVFKNREFDIIHFEFSALAILYRQMLDRFNAATVVSCRGTAEKVKPLTTPGREELLAEVFEKVHRIHCVSEDMAQTIAPYCRQKEKIFVNRPSIDATHFTRSKPYEASEKITILSVGRLTFQKGYLVGLLAIKQLKAQGANFQWVIVGDGPQWEELVFHIHTLQLQDCVTLAGKKNKQEMLDLYQDAQVFLLSSVYEGIANVVLEAMAMELPVVATRSGGLKEVIDNEEDGILIDLYDHVAMANALAQLCNNFAKRKLLGTKARQKLLGQFTIGRQVNEFEAVYASLATQNNVLHK